MSSSTWLEHFKERMAGLEPPREGSFLEVALTEGRFTEDEYLQWAMVALQLPLLDSRFFSENSPQPELLSKCPSAWRSTIFPVAEWDGVIAVACLEVPETLPPGTVCLLAAPSAMTSWWEQLAEHAQAPAASAPDGLGDLDGLSPSSDSEAPQGLNFSGLSLKTDDVPIEAIPEISETNIEPSAAPVAAAPAAPAPATPAPVATPPKQAPAAQASESGEWNVNASTEPHVFSTLMSSQKDFVQNIEAMLKSLETNYPKTMLMVMTETGKTLTPLMWSKSFGRPQVAGRVPLTAASPFRLALATEKPYHGYVVPNDVNELFAKVWNEGKMPDHLTAVPIMYMNRAVGVLIGVAGTEASTLQVLAHAEKAAAEFTKKIGGEKSADEAA